MKVSIQEKNDNPLLNRLEVSGSLEFEAATPSNVKLAETLAKELKKNVELVIVKHIYTKFGHKTATFNALIYNDKAAKDKTEMLTKHVKKQIEEDNKKAAEAKDAEKEAKEAKKKADQEAKAATEVKKEEVKEEKPAAEEPAQKAE
jgi:ribosomal protein S24E